MFNKVEIKQKQRITESVIRNIVREKLLSILKESYPNVSTLGEYNVVDGQWLDGFPHGLEHKGATQDVRMYDKKTSGSDFETIALFRRCDNRKYFYAKICPIANSKETIWKTVPLKDVPEIIRNDIKNINPRGHEPLRLYF